MLEIRLLGTVEMLVRGAHVDLGPRRQRLLLAILALEANQLVPVDRLVSLCWPGEPPRTAIHAIQVSASHLRATLAKVGASRYGIRLASTGSAYVLRGDSTCVDAHRFRHLVAEARGMREHERRADVFRQALRLWRGPALTGIGPERMRESLARGLEEARLVAVEDAVAAELSIGRHRELLGELTELADAYPLRERLTAQLMLALYRSGQGAAALAVFQRTRHRLAEELGIDPGAELRELELAILRGQSLPPQPPSGASAVAAAPGVPGVPGDGDRAVSRHVCARSRAGASGGGGLGGRPLRNWRCRAPGGPGRHRPSPA